jgi:hypothetical protein
MPRPRSGSPHAFAGRAIHRTRFPFQTQNRGAYLDAPTPPDRIMGCAFCSQSCLMVLTLLPAKKFVQQKRRRAAALPDAGAKPCGFRKREASWTAPVLWRFGMRVVTGGLPLCSFKNKRGLRFRRPRAISTRTGLSYQAGDGVGGGYGPKKTSPLWFWLRKKPPAAFCF